MQPKSKSSVTERCAIRGKESILRCSPAASSRGPNPSSDIHGIFDSALREFRRFVKPRNPALHSTAKLSRTIPASPSCVGRAADASRDWRGARRCRGGFQTRPTNGRYVAEPAKSASPDAARKERWLPVITYFAGEEASIFSSRCSAKVSETISRKLSETNCGTNWLG